MGTKDNYNWIVEARQPLFAGGAILANYEASRIGADIARLDEAVVGSGPRPGGEDRLFQHPEGGPDPGRGKTVPRAVAGAPGYRPELLRPGADSPQRPPLCGGGARQRQAVPPAGGKRPGTRPFEVQHAPAASDQHPGRDRGHPERPPLRKDHRRVHRHGPGQPAGDPLLRPPSGTGQKSGQGRTGRLLSECQPRGELCKIRRHAGRFGQRFQGPGELVRHGGRQLEFLGVGEDQKPRRGRAEPGESGGGSSSPTSGIRSPSR